MKAYFDKTGLLAFFQCIDAPTYSYCLAVLKSKLDLSFTFTKEECKKDESLMDVLLQLSDGAGDDTSTEEEYSWGNYPLLLNKKNKYDNPTFPIEELMSLTFMESVPDAEVLRRKNLIQAYGKEIITKISSLFYKDKQYSHNIFNPKEFKSWDDIKPYSLPATDIILVDTYISTNLNLASHNIIPLISSLSSKVNNTTLNIIIFSEPYKYKKNRETEHKCYLNGEKYTQLENEIKQELKSLCLKVNLTYIESDSLREHDRTIFTNYCFYVSGPSFSNIVDPKGNVISSGRNFHVHSHLDEDHMAASLDLLNSLQKVIDKTNLKYIKGSKKSMFLTF